MQVPPRLSPQPSPASEAEGYPYSEETSQWQFGSAVCGKHRGPIKEKILEIWVEKRLCD